MHPGMHQPMGGPPRQKMDFMHPLPPMPNTPPGLQYLETLDHLMVRQQLEPMEMLTGIETKNAYQVYANGFLIYWAQEESDCCSRCCCGTRRAFTMTVTDGTGAHAMRFIRPCKCSCCLCCCLQEMTVEAPMGNVVGKVEEVCNLCVAEFVCKNAMGQPVMKITGPCCMCCSVDFKVVDMNKVTVGKVTKEWSGFVQEMTSDADNFGISFPRGLPVESKALLLGACILIDFMYFEDKNKGKNNNTHH